MQRLPEAVSFGPHIRGRVKLRAQGEVRTYGMETLDLSAVGPLVDPSRLHAVGYLMAQLQHYAGEYIPSDL